MQQRIFQSCQMPLLPCFLITAIQKKAEHPVLLKIQPVQKKCRIAPVAEGQIHDEIRAQVEIGLHDAAKDIIAYGIPGSPVCQIPAGFDRISDIVLTENGDRQLLSQPVGQGRFTGCRLTTKQINGSHFNLHSSAMRQHK